VTLIDEKRCEGDVLTECDDTGNTAHECGCGTNCGEPQYEHGTCDYGPYQYTPCGADVEADARRTWTITRPNVARWP